MQVSLKLELCWLKWNDETISRLLEAVFEKPEKTFQVTDPAGCSPCWNESTHYVRPIAVFKISLTLCVSICRASGQLEKGQAKKKAGELISSDLQTLRSLITFSQAETQGEAAYILFFFVHFLYLVWGFLSRTHRHAQIQSQPALPLSSVPLSHTRKHTHKTWCMHTHTQPLLGYWTAIAVRSPLQQQGSWL